ncbi:MAG: HlyD family efflux transporter periplasmic adaptor subunit [Chloroflexota bacterium]
MLNRMRAMIALVLLLLIVSGCTLLPTTERSRTPPQGQGGPTPTPIPTPIVPTKPIYEVKQGEVIKIIQFSGRIAPVVEEELFFRSAGRVRTIYVERNDIVTTGQVLADLEIDDLERELASTRLELERAQQQQAEAQQNHNDQLSRANLRLTMANANLSDAARDQVFALARAKINLSVKELQLERQRNRDLSPRRLLAEADLQDAEITLRRAQSEYDEVAFSDSVGASSQAAALQRATIEFARAQANYELAIQDLSNQGVDLQLVEQDVAMSQLELEKLETSGPNLDLEQAVTLAQLEVDILNRGIDPIFANNVQRAKLNVEKLEAAIADAQIVAPFEGEIVTLSLTAGRDVTKYKPVVIVADFAELEVSANPLDSQLRDMTEEMPVTISLSNQPGQFYPGIIRRLPYPYGGGGRSQGVENEDTSTRISLEASPRDLGLDDGDLVRIEAVLERKADVLWLPPQAVRTFDGRRFVVIQDGDAQRRVDVKVGIESEDRVEIEDGVTLGQVIVGP